MRVLESVGKEDQMSGVKSITCNLASCMARGPLMLFSSCVKYKRDTKQGRSCTILL